MVNSCPTAAAGLLIVAAAFFPGPAQAQLGDAETTTDLNQRAGPGTRFPKLATVPQGALVTLHGCIDGYSWCDGTYRGSRGWFSARFLRILHAGTHLPVAAYARYEYVPVVSFGINSYWDRFYRDRPFYARISAYAEGGSVSVSVGSFYRPLQPYGRWTTVRGRHVFVPDVEPGWHPYTEGRWVYTRRYGWTWVSHEPHGWATHHYGRWAYSPRIGWFWIPGTRWAPAWVAFQRSDDHLIWAPLPPRQDDAFGFSIDISFGDIPNYYWRAAPARQFQSADISNVVIGDNNTIINIINQSEPAGTVEVVNNVVVNNAIDVEYIEEKTGETVVPRELALTAAEREDGEVTEETVEIFHPSELAAAERPDDVVPLEQVAETSATAGQAGDGPGTEDMVPPAPEPGQTPPEDAGQTGLPPILAEGEELEPAPAQEAAPAPETAQDGGAVCPAGTVRQADGNCGETPEASQPAEDVASEAPARETPAQGGPGQTEDPAQPEQPGEREQPAPAQDADTPRERAPAAQEACSAGTVRQADGSCGEQPAAGQPAEEVAPQAPAQESPAQDAPGRPQEPGRPEQPAKSQQPAETEQPVERDQPASPVQKADPPREDAPQEPCPAGTVRRADGSCGEPPDARRPAEEAAPQTPARDEPAQQAPSRTEERSRPEQPSRREQSGRPERTRQPEQPTAPAQEAEPRQEQAPAAQEPCPEGTTRQADGSCN